MMEEEKRPGRGARRSSGGSSKELRACEEKEGGQNRSSYKKNLADG